MSSVEHWRILNYDEIFVDLLHFPSLMEILTLSLLLKTSTASVLIYAYFTG